MVKVANDVTPRHGDLPAPGTDVPDAPPLADVSGISLRLIAGLAATAQGVVSASPEQLLATIDSTLPLRQALRRAGDDPTALAHCLVLADAASLGLGGLQGLAGLEGLEGLEGLGVGGSGEDVVCRGRGGGPGCVDADAVVKALVGARAVGLVTSGADPAAYRKLTEAAVRAGMPSIDVPLDHLGAFTTEVLSAILEHQTAVLRRLEDADRALVQIVLAGGSLDDLCEQVVGFLDGAVMVTTTDGRVIARAGSEQELERAMALECFDRTGRLLTEVEPMGPRPDGPTANRSAVRIVAGHLDHGVLMAFCSHRHLTVDDVRLLERAATVAALAITKDQ